MVDFLEANNISITEEPEAMPVESEPTTEENDRLAMFSCVSSDPGEVRMKALHCVGCGICLSRCEFGALALVDGRVEIDPEKCTGCGECLHPCVVVDFWPR